MKKFIDIFSPIEDLKLDERIIYPLIRGGITKVYQLFSNDILSDPYFLKYGIDFKLSYLSIDVYKCFESFSEGDFIEFIKFFTDSVIIIFPISGQDGYEKLKLALKDKKSDKINGEKKIQDAIFRNFFCLKNSAIEYNKKYFEPARAYIVRYLRGTREYPFEYNNDFGCLKEFSDWQIQRVIDLMIDKGYFIQQFKKYYKNRFASVALTPKGARLCLKLTPKEEIYRHENIVRRYLKIESDKFGLKDL